MKHRAGPGAAAITTMREIAKHADVSIATVSRVVNSNGYVSADLRERVHAAMRQFQYQPSALARSLRKQETRTIGVLIPQVDHPFFAALSFAIENALFDNDYRMLLCSAQEDGAKERAYAEILLRQRVDGLIVTPTGRDHTIFALFQKQDIPIVLLDRDIPCLDVSRVLVNNFKGGFDGMRHLLDLGHRRIAVVSTADYSRAMQERLDGVRAALQAHGADIAVREALVSDSLQQYEMSYRTALEVLQARPRPTAVFALTDVAAVGVMHAAAELKLALPQKLSVMGFDDIPLASFMIPTLTTIAQPIYEMGAAAARMILERIAAPETPPAALMLDASLVVRQSTAAYDASQEPA